MDPTSHLFIHEEDQKCIFLAILRVLSSDLNHGTLAIGIFNVGLTQIGE